MIEYILWWLLAVIWFGCGIWGWGIALSWICREDWSEKTEEEIANEVRWLMPLWLIMLGPITLGAAIHIAKSLKTKF